MAAEWNKLGVLPVRSSAVACYLVRAETGAVLVDTGTPGHAKRVLRALQELGLQPADVALILLTHHHPDHAGSAAVLRESLGAPVAAHPTDVPYIEAGGGPTPQGFTRVGRAMSAAMGVMSPLISQKPVPVDVELREGDDLSEFGISGHIFETPGHTMGSITVLLESGAALVGDAAVNFSGPNLPPVGEDLQATRASYSKVKELEAARLYSGHGDAFSPTELP